MIIKIRNLFCKTNISNTTGRNRSENRLIDSSTYKTILPINNTSVYRIGMPT